MERYIISIIVAILLALTYKWDRKVITWLLNAVGKAAKPFFKMDPRTVIRWQRANTPEARRVVEEYFNYLQLVILVLPVALLFVFLVFDLEALNAFHPLAIAGIVIVMFISSTAMAGLITILLGELLFRIRHPEIDVTVFRYYTDESIAYDPREFNFYRFVMLAFVIGAAFYVTFIVLAMRMS